MFYHLIILYHDNIIIIIRSVRHFVGFEPNDDKDKKEMADLQVFLYSSCSLSLALLLPRAAAGYMSSLISFVAPLLTTTNPHNHIHTLTPIQIQINPFRSKKVFLNISVTSYIRNHK